MGRGRKGRKKDRRARDAEARPSSPAPGLLGAIPRATLDLHGERAADAERKVTSFLTTQARIHSGEVVHVVTGSGLGSHGGPVLRGLVGDLLLNELAHLVAEHRLDLHRGGWLVRLG